MPTDKAQEADACGARNGERGSYECTRPRGHEGIHWTAVIVASWGYDEARAGSEGD